MTGGNREYTRLFEADPDLGRWLDPQAAAWARREVVAEVVRARRGVWEPPLAAGEPPPLGMLVLDGALTRIVALHGHRGIELFGEGDLIQPWIGIDPTASVPVVESWAALEPTRLAVIDVHTQAKLARLPGALAELFGRAVRRCQPLALHRAVTQVPQLTTRTLLLLWSIADRWGRVEPQRVVIPLRLSHQLLAALVSARRPSVTAALHELVRREVLERDPCGHWALLGDPPSTLKQVHFARVGRRSPIITNGRRPAAVAVDPADS